MLSYCCCKTISIHALREEGDMQQAQPQRPQPMNDFYPRPPRGGRRRLINSLLLGGAISIHALREEGDEVSLM